MYTLILQYSYTYISLCYSSEALADAAAHAQLLDRLQQRSSLPHVPELLLGQLLVAVGGDKLGVLPRQRHQLGVEEVVEDSGDTGASEASQHLVSQRHQLEPRGQHHGVTDKHPPESVPGVVLFSEVGHHPLGGSGGGAKGDGGEGQPQFEGGPLEEVQPPVGQRGGVAAELEDLGGLGLDVDGGVLGVVLRREEPAQAGELVGAIRNRGRHVG